MNNTHIMIRLTEGQKERLAARAASLGLPISTYVRMVALANCDNLSRDKVAPVTPAPNKYLNDSAEK